MTRILAALTLVSALTKLWPVAERWLRPRATAYVMRGFINDNHADLAESQGAQHE
jgi:hypothetical protein